MGARLGRGRSPDARSRDTLIARPGVLPPRIGREGEPRAHEVLVPEARPRIGGGGVAIYLVGEALVRDGETMLDWAQIP